MNGILQRPEVEEEQKKIVEKALEKLEEPGLTYRDAVAIQTEAFEAMGFGGGMRFGRFGGGMDRPWQSPELMW